MEHHLSVDKKEHFDAVLAKLNTMRMSEIECDFTIKAGERSLRVHRIVIRAASDYFDKMLSHDTIENQKNIVDLKEVDFEALRKCVDFMYTGEISISYKKAGELLHAANILQLQVICEKISVMLKDCLNATSFFDIKAIACKFDLISLSSTCDNFALEHLDVIAEMKEFLDFESDYVSFLIQNKISSHPRSEDSKLAIILLWINADTDNRKSHLTNMVQFLDLGKISWSYGIYLLENERICFESCEFMKRLYVHQVSERCHKVAKNPKISFQNCPAKFTELSCGVHSANKILLFDIANKTAKAYLPNNDKIANYVSLPSYMQNAQFYSTCMFGSYCYVFMPDGKASRVDTLTMQSTWEERKSMTYMHGNWLSSTACGDYVFVSGNKSVEKYHERGDVWEVVETEGVVCDQTSLVDCEGLLFSIGGGANNRALSTVNKLEVDSMIWSSVSPMRYCRATPAVASLCKVIFVVGGINRRLVDHAESYNVDSGMWTELAPLCIPRNLFRLCIVNEKIYAVGNGTESLSMETYDFKSDLWKKLKGDFNFKIMGPASVSVNLK